MSQYAYLLKACLYENPKLNSNANTIQQALCRDFWVFCVQSQQTNSEEHAPVSESFTAIMLQAGVTPAHNINRPYFIRGAYRFFYYTILRRASVPQNQHVIKEKCVEFALNALKPCSSPRSLLGLCVLRLRREYPGRRLHRKIKPLNIPGCVKDDILMEHLNTLKLQIEQ